jgi:D-serine deaminase-like pyridoxal phosphate-dependent protein
MLDELDELEPHAAIDVAAASVAAAVMRFEVVLDMPQVIAGGRSHECNTPAAARAGARGCGV